MSREILFRAKEKNNDKWIEGSFCEPSFILPTGELNLDFDYFVEVDYLKVVQFTGLTDENGTKIFEGDIVKVSTPNNGLLALDGIVVYNNDSARFEVDYSSDWRNVSFDEIDDVEVIGNIHDNHGITL